MRLSGFFLLASACAVLYAMPTGCGGSVEIVDGGGPGAVSSSSGSPGTGPSSNGGNSSGSSSDDGGPATTPQCAGQVPAIAMLCSDGSVATPYYAWNGTQCVLAFQCPPAVVNPGGPFMSSSSGSSSGAPGMDASFASCTSAASCEAGLVCCGVLTGASPGTACEVGPCPVLPVIGTAVQFCSGTSECLAGQVCEPATSGLLAQVLMGLTICQSPALDASTD